MTTENRLARSESQLPARVTAPKGMSKADREQFWIARGNRVLWGEEPDKDGEYLFPRRDLHWCCVNGHYFIEAR